MTNYRSLIIRRIYFLRRYLEKAKEKETIDSLQLRINECEGLLLAAGETA